MTIVGLILFIASCCYLKLCRLHQYYFVLFEVMLVTPQVDYSSWYAQYLTYRFIMMFIGTASDYWSSIILWSLTLLYSTKL